MSIEDMTSEQIVAEIRLALEQELQKKPLTSPAYHSGHVAIAYEVGKKDAEARIIELLEQHRISLRDISAENWVGLWHDAIALIKGENDGS